MSDRQFPIGKFAPPATITAADRAGWIERLSTAPKRLREIAEELTPAQLRTPYREGGWTARQVIHHVPDSHMNGYIRFKLGLTEDNPVIKPYDEKAWALLSDAVRTPIETSMDLLAALHERWLVVIAGMREEDWKRQFTHPQLGPMTLERQLGLYAWHGDHHIAHVQSVLD
jgi:uncharacterized damage-inducible protein DinB